MLLFLSQDVIELRRKQLPISLLVNIYADEVREYQVSHREKEEREREREREFDQSTLKHGIIQNGI